MNIQTTGQPAGQPITPFHWMKATQATPRGTRRDFVNPDDIPWTDWLMPGMKGDDFLIEAYKRFPYVVTILLSGQTGPDTLEKVRTRANLHEFIGKPWDEQALIASIDAGLARFAAGVRA